MTSAFSSQYTGSPSLVLYTDPRSMLTTRRLAPDCKVLMSSSTGPIMNNFTFVNIYQLKETRIKEEKVETTVTNAKK